MTRLQQLNACNRKRLNSGQLPLPAFIFETIAGQLNSDLIGFCYKTKVEQ